MPISEMFRISDCLCSAQTHCYADAWIHPRGASMRSHWGWWGPLAVGELKNAPLFEFLLSPSTKLRLTARARALCQRVLRWKPMLSSSRLTLSLKHLDRWREVPRCFREFEESIALLANYMGLSHMTMPTMARHRSGLRLRIDEFGDLEAIWQIFLRRVYEVRPADRVIVDAGGNVGMFSCYASWRAPQSRILTIEPFPKSVERLRTHIAENRLDERVTVLDRALTAGPSEVLMPLDTPSSQQKPVLHGRTEGKTVVRVPSLPLSEAVATLPERIDLLKMDIEGSEFEVLLHTPHTTLQRFRRINVEHHEPPAGTSYSKTGLIAHLEQTGFTVRQYAGAPGDAYGILHCEQPN
jgi:FkbM family methyltransferase